MKFHEDRIERTKVIVWKRKKIRTNGWTNGQMDKVGPHNIRVVAGGITITTTFVAGAGGIITYLTQNCLDRQTHRQMTGMALIFYLQGPNLPRVSSACRPNVAPATTVSNVLPTT